MHRYSLKDLNKFWKVASTSMDSKRALEECFKPTLSTVCTILDGSDVSDLTVALLAYMSMQPLYEYTLCQIKFMYKV